MLFDDRCGSPSETINEGKLHECSPGTLEGTGFLATGLDFLDLSRDTAKGGFVHIWHHRDIDKCALSFIVSSPSDPFIPGKNDVAEIPWAKRPDHYAHSAVVCRCCELWPRLVLFLAGQSYCESYCGHRCCC